MENESSITAPIFSCGLDVANFVVASDVLTQSYETIAGLNCISGNSAMSNGCVRINISNKLECTIIAFVTPQIDNLEGIEGAKDLVLSDTLDKKKFPFIDLLESIEPFSIHQLAANVFESAFEELDSLYTQFYNSSKPLIITGHSFGGSVAALFTLWLLGRVDPTTGTLRLCVTFGAPLIGDDKLLKAITRRSIWDSCFINVVMELDHVPRFLAVIPSSTYKPFGTYLLTSLKGCACFNDPESVTLLLETGYLTGAEVQYLSLGHYGQVVRDLRKNLVINGVRGNHEWIMQPQDVGITLQLEAIGISNSQQLCKTLGKHEQKVRRAQEIRSAMDPSKKLNDMKKYMANLEWYKKKMQDGESGYYDSFKNHWVRREHEVNKYMTLLKRFWEGIVEQAKQKPQVDGRILRTRYIGAGTNYRRMVEPLNIAQHYRQCDLDYIANRPADFARLEEWLDSERVVGNKKVRTVATNLTEDSCFWARVEQAIVWCRILARGQDLEVAHRLHQFENLIWSLVMEKTVSSDIFLGRSSFMQWWREYSLILPPDYDSYFVRYMKSGQFANYK